MAEHNTQLMVLLRTDGIAKIVRVQVDSPTGPMSLRATLNCTGIEHTTLMGGDENVNLGLFMNDCSDNRDATPRPHPPFNRVATKVLHALKWKAYRIFNKEEADARMIFGDALLYDDNRDITPELYDTIRKIVRERSAQTVEDAQAAFNNELKAESAFWSRKYPQSE